MIEGASIHHPQPSTSSPHFAVLSCYQGDQSAIPAYAHQNKKGHVGTTLSKMSPTPSPSTVITKETSSSHLAHICTVPQAVASLSPTYAVGAAKMDLAHIIKIFQEGASKLTGAIKMYA